jgi:hypothetical protein
MAFRTEQTHRTGERNFLPPTGVQIEHSNQLGLRNLSIRSSRVCETREREIEQDLPDRLKIFLSIHLYLEI